MQLFTSRFFFSHKYIRILDRSIGDKLPQNENNKNVDIKFSAHDAFLE